MARSPYWVRIFRHFVMESGKINWTHEGTKYLVSTVPSQPVSITRSLRS